MTEEPEEFAGVAFGLDEEEAVEAAAAAAEDDEVVEDEGPAPAEDAP